MMHQTEECSFKETRLDSPITQLAFAIRGFKVDKHYGSGTAVAIGPGLAITAQHVFDDLYRVLRGKPIDKSSGSSISANFGLQLVNFEKDGKAMLIWKVVRAWSANFTDVIILQVVPSSESALNWRWKSARISLIPPRVGDRVSAFGYATPHVTETERGIEWYVIPRTSVGVVREVHYEKRDLSRLPFPCFRTNARYDEAMSGGPVFDNHGRICGIICSNLPPTEPHEEHASYVTSLWPIMGVEIDMQRPNVPEGSKYPLIELAREGRISVENLGAVDLVRNSNGEIINTLIKGA